MIKLTPEKAPYYENIKQTQIYRALLLQSGTTAPEATIITNTIGPIVWTRTSAGIYLATLTGAFLEFKTWALLSNTSGDATITMTIAWLNNNSLQIVVAGQSTFEDGWLTKTPVEIITNKN